MNRLIKTVRPIRYTAGDPRAKDHLSTHGYVVFNPGIPPERIEETKVAIEQNMAFVMQGSRNPAPQGSSGSSIVSRYNIGCIPELNRLRYSSQVVEVFEKLYGAQVICSADGVCYRREGLQPAKRKRGYTGPDFGGSTLAPHVDEGTDSYGSGVSEKLHSDYGLSSVQGVLQLDTTTGATFVVQVGGMYPKHIEKPDSDFCKLTGESLIQFMDTCVRVHLQAGDLLVFLSCVPHCNTACGDRTAIYITGHPDILAPKEREKLREFKYGMIRKGYCGTHWPYKKKNMTHGSHYSNHGENKNRAIDCESQAWDDDLVRLVRSRV